MLPALRPPRRAPADDAFAAPNITKHTARVFSMPPRTTHAARHVEDVFSAQQAMLPPPQPPRGETGAALLIRFRLTRRCRPPAACYHIAICCARRHGEPYATAFLFIRAPTTSPRRSRQLQTMIDAFRRRHATCFLRALTRSIRFVADAESAVARPLIQTAPCYFSAAAAFRCAAAAVERSLIHVSAPRHPRHVCRAR